MKLNNDIALSIGAWLDGDLSNAELNAAAADIRERRHGKKLAGKVLSKGKRNLTEADRERRRDQGRRMAAQNKLNKLKLTVDAPSSDGVR